MLRPAALPDPANGLLCAEHFQIAYATVDIDAACALVAAQHGVREFRRLEGQTPSGAQMRVELAWVGGFMIELLTSSGPGSEIYMSRVRPDAPMTLHHLGYLVDEAGWEALMARVASENIALPHVSHNAGFMKSCFVDPPGLGHYLEYICPEAAGVAFFEGVPAS
jgi:hypothetical protein